MNIQKIVFINKNNRPDVLFLFIFFAVGGGLFWSLKVSDNQIKIPDSCYLSPLAITIEVAQKNYSDCKNNVQSLEADINFEKTDQKISKLTTQLNPKEQLTSRTGKVVDSIFQEIREDIYSQSKSNSIVFSFLLVLFFLWYLCLIVLFFSLPIFL